MTTTTTRLTNADRATQLQALIQGLQNKLPNQQFQLGGTAFTTATLVQALQKGLDVLTAMLAAHKAETTAVQAWDAQKLATDPLVTDLRAFLRTTLGTNPTALAAFGLEPPKARAPLTTQQKAAAAAKAAATRKARGTTGKKQKLAVTGNVTGVTIVPITEPAATVPTATAPTTAPAAAPQTPAATTAPAAKQ